MAATTIYDLAIKIALQGVAAAKAGMAGLTGGIKGASDALGRFGLAAAGLRTLLQPLSWGKSALIDFNSELEASRIGLATMAAMNLRAPFKDALAMSELMVTRFQELAVKSPATTKDYVDMAQGIAGAAYSAGLSTSRLMSLTNGAVIAGTAFGVRADVMALDVSQALKGTLTARDRIGSMIQAATGLSAKQFNKLDANKRASAVEKTLNDPAIKAAAEAYANTWQGQLSTLKDTIQMTLGRVGVPLMKQMTAEVARWNAWIQSHPEKIKQWAKDFSDALVRGFNMVKAVFGWIVEHREILMKVALALAALKIGGGVVGTLGQIVPALGTFGLALAAASTALYLLAQIPGGRTGVENVMAQRKLADVRQGWGYRERAGTLIDVQRFGKYARNDLDMQAQMAVIAHDGLKTAAKGMKDQRHAAEAALGVAEKERRAQELMDKANKRADAGKNPGVYVAKVEINSYSDNPDNITEALGDTFSRLLRSGSQADTAWRSAWG